jgi:hypothetical protein
LKNLTLRRRSAEDAKKKRRKKMRKFLIIGLALALATFACDDGKDEETPSVPEPTTVSLSFVASSGTPADGNFNVTVKSDDAYLSDVWTALVNSVKVALETAYADPDIGPGDRAALRDVFGVADATVVLKDDLATNWEVKVGGTQGILYIKTSVVSTITASSYVTAAVKMAQNNSSTSQE